MCRPHRAIDSSTQGPAHGAPDRPLFTIRPLNSSTYLIRENDSYGEHPHIYAKLHTSPSGRSVIILSDIGVGTSQSGGNDIWGFLASTINPDHQHPYILILSHCHYDHILGLAHLPTAPSFRLTVAASSRDPAFSTPYSSLQEHSLCASMDLHAPPYTVGLWLHDEQALPAPPSLNLGEADFGITALHTPGHTPDSLSWYDASSRMLYVGDSFYSQRSVDSQDAPWGDEGNAPIMFPREGDLAAWWASLNKLVKFVETVEGECEEDDRTLGKVVLAAGHVSVGVEAYGILLRARAFMGRVLRQEMECEMLPVKRGWEMGRWNEDQEGTIGEFSLVAPLKVIEEGRMSIPEEEWR